MKIEVEIATDMSRPETFRALRIVFEATTRLARRMTNPELERIEEFGRAMIAVARQESQSRNSPPAIVGRAVKELETA